MAKSVSSGTRTLKDKPPIVSGTRRRVYQHDEHWVMINMDRFENLENVIQSRSKFSHLGTTLVAAGFPLGVEMFLQVYNADDPVALGVLIVCIAACLFGAAFFLLAMSENRKYTNVKTSLFSQDKLLSDESITIYEDGSSTRISHPVTTARH